MNKMEFSKVSYDNFSKIQWYREVNRHLVMLSGIGRKDRVLDAGAGTGSSTELICENIDGHGEVIALDLNRDYLNIAKHKLFKYPNVRFVEADALKAAEFIEGYLDGAFIFNAIHLIEDYRHLFKILSDLLEPGGFLAFNSTYFKENESEFRRFQSELLIEVVRGFLRQGRDFSNREQMFVRSCEDYREEVMNIGFEVVRWEIKDVDISPESLLDFYCDRDVPVLYPPDCLLKMSGFISSPRYVKCWTV